MSSDFKEGTVNNPLPSNTSKTAPKVRNATLTAGTVIGVLVMLAQLLYSRADLIAFLPDFWEPIVLALVTALATYGVGYQTRHQVRTPTHPRTYEADGHTS